MLLRPGLFARVKATLGVQKNALVVPIDSLITVQNLHQLAVVGPDNKVSIRNVNVILSTRDEAVVDSGVSAGEKIVVQGIQKVIDGCTVMPLPATPNKAPSMNSPSEGTDNAKKVIPAAPTNPQPSGVSAAKS